MAIISNCVELLNFEIAETTNYNMKYVITIDNKSHR